MRATSRRALRFSVCAILLSVLPARAQDTAASNGTAGDAAGVPTDGSRADSAHINSSFATLGQNLSSPELPPSLPATPHRLALMQQYMEAANVPAALKAISALSLEQSRTQFLPSIKTLPASRQAVVIAAFNKAFEAADARRQQKAMAAMADYYATRMTDEELATVVGFYSSGLGRKMLRDGQHVTPDERQQSGRYVLEHPAMLKFTKLDFDYMKHALAMRPANLAAFQTDFRASLCRNLASAHLQSTACVAAHA